MQAPSAGTVSQNGPQSPFEDVKLEGPDETWWGANEQLHLQRMQEQEKQRAAQLQHTRAWAEAQVNLRLYPSIMSASLKAPASCSLTPGHSKRLDTHHMSSIRMHRLLLFGKIGKWPATGCRTPGWGPTSTGCRFCEMRACRAPVVNPTAWPVECAVFNTPRKDLCLQRGCSCPLMVVMQQRPSQEQCHCREEVLKGRTQRCSQMRRWRRQRPLTPSQR